MDYEKDTRLAYNDIKAKKYKEQQTKGISWMRLTTWRERLCVKKAIKECKLTKTDKILDIPCGTGILADILSKFSSYIVASDISREMMNFTLEDYKANIIGFIQADITKTPFKKDTFNCVITIGLMHRLPVDIRLQTLQEITSISNRFIIISYSIDSPSQRLKHWMIGKIFPSHKSAPSPLAMQQISRELDANKLVIKRKFNVITFLSAEVILLLEKRH